MHTTNKRVFPSFAFWFCKNGLATFRFNLEGLVCKQNGPTHFSCFFLNCLRFHWCDNKALLSFLHALSRDCQLHSNNFAERHATGSFKTCWQANGKDVASLQHLFDLRVLPHLIPLHCCLGYVAHEKHDTAGFHPVVGATKTLGLVLNILGKNVN